MQSGCPAGSVRSIDDVVTGSSVVAGDGASCPVDRRFGSGVSAGCGIVACSTCGRSRSIGRGRAPSVCSPVCGTTAGGGDVALPVDDTGSCPICEDPAWLVSGDLVSGAPVCNGPLCAGAGWSVAALGSGAGGTA